MTQLSASSEPRTGIEEDQEAAPSRLIRDRATPVERLSVVIAGIVNFVYVVVVLGEVQPRSPAALWFAVSFLLVTGCFGVFTLVERRRLARSPRPGYPGKPRERPRMLVSAVFPIGFAACIAVLPALQTPAAIGYFAGLTVFWLLDIREERRLRRLEAPDP